jgi:hypothetical protein
MMTTRESQSDFQGESDTDHEVAGAHQVQAGQLQIG